MTSKFRLPLLAALLAAAPAWAATLYTLPAATTALDTNTSVSASFGASSGAGSVVFTLAGYGSLDGDNYYIDILQVTLNGSEVFSGTWNIGGGGADRVLFNPNGATGGITGQQLSIMLPVALVAGNNDLVFTYTSPVKFEGIDRAGFQGVGDEAWGLNALTVTGISPVPEPASAAMLLAGLGMFGWAASRRR